MAALDLAGSTQPYQDVYGLREPPFGLNPDPRFFFESRAHRTALDLIFGAGHSDPAVIIAGDPRTGKTLLCRVAADHLPPRTFLAVVPSPLVDRTAFFAQVLEQFGILSHDRHALPEPSGDALVAALKQFLASLPQLQAQAVIIMDDAQEVRPELLAEIRTLTNANTDANGGRRLRIVLLGEPALLELLVGSSQQLLARTSDARVLSPLAADEVESYIERRLWIARGSPVPDTPGPDGVIFARDAVTAVFECSSGVPGTINALCDRALDDTAARRKHVVDRSAIVAAAQQMGLSLPMATRFRSVRALVLAAVLVLLAGVWWFQSGRNLAWPWRSSLPSQTAANTRRAGTSDTVAAPAAAGTASAEVPAAASPAASGPAGGPAAPVEPSPVATAPAPVVNAPLAQAESFTVLVASFRTTSRAQAATDTITKAGLPAYMRAIQGGWNSVVVGPFLTRQEADAARERLDRAHFTDSRVISTPSTDTAPTPSTSSAVLSAVWLPVTGRDTVVIDLGAGGTAAIKPSGNPRTLDLEVSALPGHVDDQDFVPARQGIVERVSVRGTAQGNTSVALVSVTARSVLPGAIRQTGARIYVDLTPPVELPPAPAAPPAAAERPTSAPTTQTP